jgi:hypothetical protein
MDLSQVNMDQNVLEDVQNSLPKEPIDNKSEYEKYLKTNQKIVMHGLLYTRVSLLQGNRDIIIAYQRKMHKIQQQKHCVA